MEAKKTTALYFTADVWEIKLPQAEPAEMQFILRYNQCHFLSDCKLTTTVSTLFAFSHAPLGSAHMLQIHKATGTVKIELSQEDTRGLINLHSLRFSFHALKGNTILKAHYVCISLTQHKVAHKVFFNQIMFAYKSNYLFLICCLIFCLRREHNI